MKRPRITIGSLLLWVAYLAVVAALARDGWMNTALFLIGTGPPFVLFDHVVRSGDGPGFFGLLLFYAGVQACWVVAVAASVLALSIVAFAFAAVGFGLHPLDPSGFLSTVVGLILGLILLYGLWRLGGVIRREWRRPSVRELLANVEPGERREPACIPGPFDASSESLEEPEGP